MVAVLSDPFYSEAHQVFRQATNQSELMLDHMGDLCRDLTSIRVLSVGAGAGLFELPMLTMLRDFGIGVAGFVGVDPSLHARVKMEKTLQRSFGDELDFELVTMPFELFESSERFDIVLFNHVFEYLGGDPLTWVRKALSLTADGGKVLIFSPLRGGINGVYEDVYVDARGVPPLFADDIERLLSTASIPFVKRVMTASCDVALLHRQGPDLEKLKLLSFLTQTDCRELEDATREGYADYYLSLREPGVESIAHPAALFII